VKDERIQEYAEELGELIPTIARAIPGEASPEVVRQAFDVDVSTPELFVLSYLPAEREPNMSEIGRALSIDVSTLTRLVDKLVDKSLVERRSDPHDRRMVKVRLAERGKEIILRVEKEKKRRIVSILRRLSNEEIESLLKIMRIIHDRISVNQT